MTLTNPAEKIAVVLFNLGGPDGPDDVQPFLKNLFSDKAIIRSPLPVRFIVSRMISKSRAPSARENYARMGGGSPLLPETKKQAAALDAFSRGARRRSCYCRSIRSSPQPRRRHR